MKDLTAREGDLIKNIQVELSKVGARLFRNNTGQAWVGKVLQIKAVDSGQFKPGSYIALEHARPFHAGLCEGSSDLIGWSDDGRFVAIEVKTKNTRRTDAQRNFIHQVNLAGGIAFFCYSVEEAIENYKKGVQKT